MVLVAFFTLGYLMTIAFRIPERFDFPLPIRLVGLATVVPGLIFFSWLFRYGRPADVLVSTYMTFS